jgi:hypothetical protein
MKERNSNPSSWQANALLNKPNQNFFLLEYKYSFLKARSTTLAMAALHGLRTTGLGNPSQADPGSAQWYSISSQY